MIPISSSSTSPALDDAFPVIPSAASPRAAAPDGASSDRAPFVPMQSDANRRNSHPGIRAFMRSAASAHAPNYQSKTPYAPQQDMTLYEAPPAGYVPVGTQVLARHGSRGLNGFKPDLAMHNLWLLAEREGALTPLGQQLGPDILALMQANFVLGHGVPGIGKPGYGNETRQGMAEHAGLARRMVARLPSLFADDGTEKQVAVITSGKGRAVDSGHFFVEALLAERPGLTPSVVYPVRPAPAGALAQPAGIDRYALYFHRLGEGDQVADPAAPLHRTYQASLAYQTYAKSGDWNARKNAILGAPHVAQTSRLALARLFSEAFLDRLDSGALHAANTGTRTFASADGRFASTLTGNGSVQINSSTDAAQLLYALYCAAGNMQAELPVDFTRYVLPEHADVFAYVKDAQEFYKKGPASTEQEGMTYRMAQTLKDDFLQQVDAVAAGNLAQLAKLRFAHAETIMPFAALLRVPGMSEALPAATPYTYENSAWRGAAVAPMAANVQWDVYRNDAGAVVLRMLYNERETDFAAACDGARLAPRSHFYNYAALRPHLARDV